MVIKRVSPGSVAKVALVLYGLLGLIGGAIVALFSATLGSLASMGGGENRIGMLPGMFMGVGAIVIMPILYGVFGAIVAAISAVIYNIVAGWVGGIQIDVQ